MSHGRESPFWHKAVLFIVAMSCDRNLLVSSTPQMNKSAVVCSILLENWREWKKNPGWKIPEKDQTYVKVGRHHAHTIGELKL